MIEFFIALFQSLKSWGHTLPGVPVTPSVLGHPGPEVSTQNLQKY